MKKLIYALFSVVIIFLLNTTNVYAMNLNMKEYEEQKYEKFYDLSEEEIYRNEQEQINEYLNRLNNKRNPEYDYEYVSKPSGSPVTVKKGIGFAGGQPSNGTVFNSPGGFLWQDGGYNQSVSIGIGGKLFSISVSAGKVNATTGIYISAPAKVPVKLYVSKDIKSQKYIVYRKNIATGSMTYYSEHYTHTPVRNYFDVKKV